MHYTEGDEEHERGDGGAREHDQCAGGGRGGDRADGRLGEDLQEAEADVPLAMSEAFRSGNLGVMDYYRMRNIESDTDMRTTISQDGEDRPDEVRDEE